MSGARQKRLYSPFEMRLKSDGQRILSGWRAWLSEGKYRVNYLLDLLREIVGMRQCALPTVQT
ncbi:hypothetical protein CK219_28205 [Mesorhizobium sp. WSM4313]|nr:hypothetical protein CK219_28205 [Mesorhizobium sp. WSM4313]